MSLINVSHLTFAYDGSCDNIFEDVSFQLDTDWKLGFVGRNGRGKTTFLNLLMGRYEYSGSISASVAFDYFPYPVEDESQDTLAVAESIRPGLMLWELCRELSLLEVEEDVLYRPFRTLSHGERTKVLLAVLFLGEGRFLLIDEPTNHLDMAARSLVGDYLDGKRGFILVSHDRAFLDGCVDHILSINKADIQVMRGNFSTWQQNKELRDQFELAQSEKLKKDIGRLTEAARRTAGWSDAVERTKKGTRNSGLRPDRGHIGHKAAKMMKRAKSTEIRRQKAVEEKSSLLKNLEKAESLAIHPLRHHKEVLAEARELSVSYGGRTVFEDVSFTLRRGEHAALCGRNGCGKSSIVKLIAGEDIPHHGFFQLAGGLIVSYVPQDASWLGGGLRDFALASDIDESLFKAILRKLDFSRVQFEKDMSDLSAGQKKKVLLARSLCQQAHLYLWDEPLNYIDVLSRIQIEELIRGHEFTMLFVEHDRAFVENVADKVICL